MIMSNRFDGKGKPYPYSVFTEPQDRIDHIAACKERDRVSSWGLVMLYNPKTGKKDIVKESHYENLGNNASIHCWMVHDVKTGFWQFYKDTPAWVIDIARKMGVFKDVCDIRQFSEELKTWN